ncbi:hypothetical protein NUU61_008624 [Penicillium alfredii]|uniref:Uncharacterized protein n=1 Tax=Penicillium alfredii TaxID=1506179 RepID=A0A9W9JWH2_9EURO|nr:uncharacterized protein NUU61_008624 [Penicillium alfredii]KAJ5084045.1 hypothetical protein NUU61_008624 [Penicillium alfredii]
MMLQPKPPMPNHHRNWHIVRTRRNDDLVHDGSRGVELQFLAEVDGVHMGIWTCLWDGKHGYGSFPLHGRSKALPQMKMEGKREGNTSRHALHSKPASSEGLGPGHPDWAE